MEVWEKASYLVEQTPPTRLISGISVSPGWPQISLLALSYTPPHQVIKEKIARAVLQTEARMTAIKA
jgi:hypothetical protein